MEFVEPNWLEKRDDARRIGKIYDFADPAWLKKREAESIKESLNNRKKYSNVRRDPELSGFNREGW